MILEKLSNNMNPPKKTHVDTPGNRKKTISPDKIGSMGVGIEGRVEGEEEGRRGGLSRT